MKSVAKRCECGILVDPIQLEIVKDAWIDRDGFAHFSYDCTSCKKENEIEIEWDEKIS